MTYNAAASVAYAKTQVGYHEGANNSNKFSPWQGLDDNNPWCASFVCYCAVQAGGYHFPTNSTFGIKGEAYTPTMKTRAQQEGIWRDKHWRALPGDFVEFDWGNNGVIDHVELVIYDDGVNIITIGGNTSDQVAYRKRDRTYVAGFVALSQSPQAKPVLDPAAIAGIKKLIAWQKDVTKTPLEQADTNGNVTVLNQLLVARGLMATTKYMNTYTKATRDAVVHFKRLAKLPNDVGTRFGGDAAAAILAPR